MSSFVEESSNYFYGPWYCLSKPSQEGWTRADVFTNICLGPNPGVAQDQTHTHTHTHTQSRHTGFNFWCVSALPRYKWKSSITCSFWASRQVANSSSWCQQREGTVCFSAIVIGIIILHRLMALWPPSHNKTLRKWADEPCWLIFLPFLHIRGCFFFLFVCFFAHLHVRVIVLFGLAGLKGSSWIDPPHSFLFFPPLFFSFYFMGEKRKWANRGIRPWSDLLLCWLKRCLDNITQKQYHRHHNKRVLVVTSTY